MTLTPLATAESPETDHEFKATFAGSLLWQCPRCWNVNVGNLRWSSPWALCRGCRRAVTFGLLATTTPNESYAATRDKARAERLNRRVPPADGVPIFAQLDGLCRWQCDCCHRLNKRYPVLPTQQIVCACGARAYLNLLIWRSGPGVALRKILPNDWILPASKDAHNEPERTYRRAIEASERTGSKHAAGLNAVRRLGRPLRGESRDSYLARLAEARKSYPRLDATRGSSNRLALVDERRECVDDGASGAADGGASGPF